MRNDIDQQVLGVIIRELENELRAQYGNGFNKPSFEHLNKIDSVYKEFDNALKMRPDYELWRLHMTPHYAFSRPWLIDIHTARSQLGDTALTNLLEACVLSENLLVQWSTVGIVSELVAQLAQQPIGVVENETIFKLIFRLYGRVRFEFVALDFCPASCGMATFYLLLTYQHTLRQRGITMSVSECRDFIDAVIQALGLVDQNWSPGKRPRLDAIAIERKHNGRLVPGHDAYQFSRFAAALFSIQPVISESISYWSDAAETLLMDSYLFSVTSWLVARSRRIFESKYQKQSGFFETNSNRSRNQRIAAYKQEMRALLMTGIAARDAGQYLDVSRAVYLYLRTIPDEFVNEKWIRDEIDGENRRMGLFHYVGEGGLAKDERFSREERSDLIAARSAGRQVGWAKMCEEAQLSDDIAYPDDPSRPSGLVLHMKHDMQILPDWQVLLKEASAKGQSHWGYLLTIEKNIADFGFDASPEALAAAFRLALRYGHVRSAGKILARSVDGKEFPLTPDHVIDFMHAVRKTTQLDPFGMRLDYLDRWQKLLLDGWQRVINTFGPDSILDKEIPWLHETLLNRTIALFGNLSATKASLLYQSNAGLISAPQLRAFYEEEYDFVRRGSGVANVQTISAYLADTVRLGGRNAVAISVVRIGERLSFLALDSRGNVIVTVKSGTPTEEELDSIMIGANQWFEYPDIDFDDQIFWTPSMLDLAKTALELGRSLENNLDTIFIAGEPWLLKLPLQHLFCLNSGMDVLICLTPNFSSLPYRGVQNGTSNITEVYSRERDSEMQNLVDRLSELTSRYRSEIGVSFTTIVGHGTRAVDSGLPSVLIAEDHSISSADEWIDVLRGEVIIIHSCHLASSEPVVLHDLGGVVGLAYSFGCQSFLAPVAEVHSNAAEHLHRHVLSNSENIGDAYMKAIQEEGGVSVYALYGDPCLSLRRGDIRNKNITESLSEKI